MWSFSAARLNEPSAGVAACQRPGDGQPVMNAPPQQFRGGDPAPLAKRIDKGRLDGAFREIVSLNRLVDRLKVTVICSKPT